MCCSYVCNMCFICFRPCGCRGVVQGEGGRIYLLTKQWSFQAPVIFQDWRIPKFSARILPSKVLVSRRRTGDMPKWLPGRRFSSFLAPSQKICQNCYQEINFHHFWCPARKYVKMVSRELIFVMFGARLGNKPE